jgi:hypothetical protein
MKITDFITQLYIFGTHVDGRSDVGHLGNDLLTGVDSRQAERLLALSGAQVAAMWWLFDALTDERRKEFLAIVSEMDDAHERNGFARAQNRLANGQR